MKISAKKINLKSHQRFNPFKEKKVKLKLKNQPSSRKKRPRNRQRNKKKKRMIFAKVVKRVVTVRVQVMTMKTAVKVVKKK